MVNNKNVDLNFIKKTFVKQHGGHTCGIACLTSVIKYHGGDIQQERLQNMSGTTLQGTTLLGIYQAAQKNGLDAEGYECGGVKDLMKLHDPVILHVVKDGVMEHYVVCYGFSDERFIIGDPAWGVTQYTVEEMESVWKSKMLLTLAPNKSFTAKKSTMQEKKKWVKYLVKEDIPTLAVASFLGIFVAVFGLAIAVFTQRLIDDFIPAHDSHKLIIAIVVLGIFLLVQAVVSYMRGVFLLKQGRLFNNRVISFFFNKLLYLPKTFFDSCNTGEFIARMNDTQRIQKSLVFITGSMLIDLLKVIISSAFLFYYSTWVGIIALVSIPCFGLLAVINNNKVIAKQREVMAAHAELESSYINTIQGISTIKSENKENWFSALVKKIYSSYQEKIYSIGLLGTKIGLWSQVISIVVLTFVITLCSIMVLNGNLRVGQMMALMSIVSMIIPSVGNLALANIQLQEARVAFDRMYEFASSELEYEKVDDENKKDWEFDGMQVDQVSFRFPGRSLLLDDVSFNLQKGEIVTLFGEIGCGKSTLLGILQRFYSYDSGDIRINGDCWNNIDIESWRKHVAVVPQQPQLFVGTIASNIKVGIKDEKEYSEIINFCKREGFDRFFESFQQGYMTLVGENGVNLSGGQQQLILLARALYSKPKLLLLDEPTSAMDRVTEQFVLEVLNRRKADMGILLVTHRIQLAKHTNKIYLLENGTITVSGNHEQLIASDNLYKMALVDISR